MKRVLVTGASGFVGKHLLRELEDQGLEYLAIGNDNDSNIPNVDLTKPDPLDEIVSKEIEAVIHLAGLAAVGPSFDDPLRYINNNAAMQINLFESFIKKGCSLKFLIISSGSIYSSKVLPVSEKSEISPTSPYSVSKLTQEQLAAYYAHRGFEIVVARPFNHIGPGQNEGFLLPDLAKQQVLIELGKAVEISAGDLSTKRDYTDVRDIVKAYVALLEKGHPGEVYNVCSGKPLSGDQLLKMLQDKSVKAPVKTNRNRIRSSEISEIYGDSSKITAHTGWIAEINIEDTVTDVLADWRGRLS